MFDHKEDRITPVIGSGEWKMLVLNDDLLIGKGGERSCYVHPEDHSKVVKTVFAKGKHNRQNELEYTYYQTLQKRNIDFLHIARCYGFVETNLGKGLVFDRILNYDGSESYSLRYIMAHRMVTEELQLTLLNELNHYLNNNTILFVDTSLTNVFCQQYEPKKYRLIIIDGLGAKRVGFKSWLYQHSKFYTLYKMKRQWSKFMMMYHKDMIRIHEGKQPITRF